jgi:hypothetical protein
MGSCERRLRTLAMSRRYSHARGAHLPARASTSTGALHPYLRVATRSRCGQNCRCGLQQPGEPVTGRRLAFFLYSPSTGPIATANRCATSRSVGRAMDRVVFPYVDYFSILADAAILHTLAGTSSCRQRVQQKCQKLLQKNEKFAIFVCEQPRGH